MMGSIFMPYSSAISAFHVSVFQSLLRAKGFTKAWSLSHLLSSQSRCIFLAKAFTYACLELASGRMTKKPGGVLKAMSPVPLESVNLHEVCSMHTVRIPPLPD